MQRNMLKSPKQQLNIKKPKKYNTGKLVRGCGKATQGRNYSGRNG